MGDKTFTIFPLEKKNSQSKQPGWHPHLYDILGSRVATMRSVGASVPACPLEWRKTEALSSFVLSDSIIWLTQTNIVSCSDFAIAPFVSSSSRQLTGLTQTLPVRSRTTDIRGNVTVNELLVDLPFVTSRQIVPYATNKPQTTSRYGVELQTVSVSAVTNSIAYDYLGRQISNIDGRGSTTHTEYNSLGQQSASIDALGNRTSYAYDQFGNLVSVIDPLGNATVYEYDLRGNKTYEGGATYPVRYTYDIFGNKITMTTYRNAGGPTSVSASGDVTTWLYDIASGSMTNKIYADGKGSSYSYSPDGKLSQRTWARGITTDYFYDAWGSLTNTVYSDNTPTVSLAFDALGRQSEAHDAAGVTTFLYDSFGSLTNEIVIGVAGTNEIERFYDIFGRDAGYALNGVRQSTLAYDPATGRLASMLAVGSDSPFTWSYLPCSDLKSSLAYPNGLTAFWSYDANNQLLQVCNAFPTNTISQYDYTYDVAGRRVSCAKSGNVFARADTIAYGYNNRSELTNAVAAVDSKYRYAYDFDDIGNREASSEGGTNSVYTANQLNQYTMVGRVVPNAPQDEFIPQFDDDGNQTLIKTASGVWQVQYNGENRPILWQSISTNSLIPSLLSMSYDRMGRRVTKNAQRFVYDGYLCIGKIEDATSIHYSLSPIHCFVWDPTEKVATRPLAWLVLRSLGEGGYYTHDGNKNVSEVIAADGDVCAHYEYAPFGAVAVQSGKSASTNPWRFSSEFADDATKTIYYIFRCNQPLEGRWLSRDPIEEHGGMNLQEIVGNNPISRVDRKGLYVYSLDRCQRTVDKLTDKKNQDSDYAKYKKLLDARAAALRKEGRDASSCSVKVFCDCCRGIRNLRTAGFYQAPAEGKSSGKIVICKNALSNMNLKYDYDYEKKAKKVLNHEMLHAVQECYPEKFKTPCEESICQEINAYYNANTGDTSIYRCEKERKDAVLDGVLYSSSFVCYPGTAPKITEKQKQRLERDFKRLYEKCKNKWPKKRQFDRRK